MSLLGKVHHNFHWFPAYMWHRMMCRAPEARSPHLIITVANHFEPSILPATRGEHAPRWQQEQRLQRWCREYPKAVRAWPDSDGLPFRHTYFFPAEQYDKALIDSLAESCRQGWGEIEIHLHHGIDAPDTPENTRRQLVEFRDALVGHGCLSQMDGKGSARYAFVHGNFALANSFQGVACGVDAEMQILAETGCYADLTLPSAPNPSQVAKVNSLYECALPLEVRAPHRKGRDLECGRVPRIFPLIIQGPLMLNFRRRERGWPSPSIENGALTKANPPTMERVRMWQKAAIMVGGRPDWLFIKLHCHGMDPRDNDALLGTPMREFLRQLAESARNEHLFQTHFVTVREMTNIILAACDGRTGNPSDYRDYRLRLIRPGSNLEDELKLAREEVSGEN